MIAQEDYRQRKEAVLSLYQDKFMPLVYEACSVTGDKTLAETRLNNLVIQAEKIKNDKFTLMVAGEAKSGKSTFINAYLGVDILPMDMLQCTSAIVEIHYAPEMMLTATYADGRQTVIGDMDAIKAFLRQNAAVEDRFRDIPVPIINEEIIVKKKGKSISKQEIDLIMAGISKDKPSGMPDEVYKEKVVAYINEKSPVWNEIISKIEIGYPFKDKAMKDITIVDSPGVGSEGHVGDVTYKYISSADAIFFLKSVSGQDLQSSSFNEFITNRAVAKKKDVLFLAFTRIASENTSDVRRVYDQAVKLFDGIIQKEQILTVDSKAQLFFNEVKDLTLEDIKALYKKRKAEDTLDKFVQVAWSDADHERDAFLEELQALSRFKSVNETLNRFARKAHYVQLRDFLNNILAASKQIVSILKTNVDFYRIGLRDPKELEATIGQIQKDLAEDKRRMNETLSDLRSKYIDGDECEISIKAEEVVERYLESLARIEGEKEGRFQKLEDLSKAQVDVFVKFQEQVRKDLIARCNEKLVQLHDERPIKMDEIITPQITSEMIEKVKEDEHANSYDYTEIEKGVTFLKTKEKVPVFSEDKYYKNVRNNIIDRIKDIKATVVGSLKQDVIAVCKVYKNELSKNIETQKKRLINVENDQRDNEAKIEMLKQLDDTVGKFSGVDARIKSEEEAIGYYVDR